MELNYTSEICSTSKISKTNQPFSRIIGLKKGLLFTFLLLFVSFNLTAQSGGTCAEIQPFCAGNDALIFANCNNQDPNCTPTAEAGPDYACLATQPFPAWFFLQIDEPGDLDFQIVQNTEFDVNGDPIGAGLDVDFIAWGPFQPGDDLCDYGELQAANEVDCSYSAAPIEDFNITNAMSGEIYVLLITNFNQAAGFIKLQQIGGQGTTNCGIVCGIEIDQEDQVLCDADDYLLTTTPTGVIENYEWYLDGMLIAGENGDTLLVTETGEYEVIADSQDCNSAVSDTVTITFLEAPCTIDPICDSVDFNEDFGTGLGRDCIDPTFTTYTCNTAIGTMINDGEYALSNTSAGLNTGWHPDMEDHTPGDTDGRAFFVNADFNPGEFYRRTITLSSSEDYTFNAWITTVYDTDTGICGGTGIPSNVIFRIEDPAGVLVAETNTGDIDNGADPNWQEFSINFNTGANTDIQLVLINNSIGGCGNDLAIDDITLSLQAAQPELMTPPDMEACDISNDGTEVFDLDSQIPTILNGLDPAQFNVSFHSSLFDAESDQNPLAMTFLYSNTMNPEAIFVRVERISEETCFSTVTFNLILNQVFDIQTDLPAVLDVCDDEALPVLDATPTNTGIDISMVSYNWTDASGSSVSTDALFMPLVSGIYTVVIDAPPCSQATFMVEVNIVEAFILDLGPDETICEGGTFEIVPIITGDVTDATYEWSTGDLTPTITVTNSGSYTLTITKGSCVVSDSIEVFIADPIEVSLGEDFLTCPNEMQTLVATVQGDGFTYQWLLNGDVIAGETSATLDIVIPLGTSGSLTYTVIVAEGDCTGQDSIDINLYDVDNCIISEGISPNGDSFNQSLDLTFLSDRSGRLTMRIYNRLGRLVYERNAYIDEWEGQTTDGAELPTGVYFYVIDIENEDAVYGNQAIGDIYVNRDAN